jgi:hypothetical protein
MQTFKRRGLFLFRRRRENLKFAAWPRSWNASTTGGEGICFGFHSFDRQLAPSLFSSSHSSLKLRHIPLESSASNRKGALILWNCPKFEDFRLAVPQPRPSHDCRLEESVLSRFTTNANAIETAATWSNSFSCVTWYRPRGV